MCGRGRKMASGGLDLTQAKARLTYMDRGIERHILAWDWVIESDSCWSVRTWSEYYAGWVWEQISTPIYVDSDTVSHANTCECADCGGPPDMVGNITVEQLPSGYYHVRGVGPCNWAQPPHWPCDEDTLRAHAFHEASEEFIRSALAQSRGERSL
jgi:hypothetical protein